MTSEPHSMSLDRSVVTDPDVTHALPQLQTDSSKTNATPQPISFFQCFPSLQAKHLQE
jgi:hypothetical protein